MKINEMPPCLEKLLSEGTLFSKIYEEQDLKDTQVYKTDELDNKEKNERSEEK